MKIAHIFAVFAACLLVLLGGASVASAGAKNGQSAEFWFVSTSGQSFEDSVLRAADAVPGGRAAAVAVFSRMLSNDVSALDLPEAAGRTSDQRSRSVSSVLAALKAGKKAQVPIGGQQPNTITAGPAEFPVRGTNQRLWWENMPYIIELWNCTNGCNVTDRLTVRLTVNPGAVTSRIDFNSTYLPSTGRFSMRHVEYFALCNSGMDACGQGNHPSSGNIATSGSFNVSSSRAMNGRNLAHGFTAWVFVSQGSFWVGDSARTGQSFCNTSDNRCFY